MKNKLVNVLLLVFSTCFTLVVLEIGVRVYKSEFSFHNFIEQKRTILQSAYPAKYDKEVGWIPKEGYHPKNAWNTRVTILNDGIRSNGSTPLLKSTGTILTVGDSFTFGDQVSDDETWPALLENISKSRVINGGVFGYGVDQSFLRMRTLSSMYRPDSIIFSFIPDDIRRCEYSERASVTKPYFDISENGDLVLMKEHTQQSAEKKELDIFRKIVGYSLLADKLIGKAAPEYWLQGMWRSTKAHSKGVEITCRIFKQLKDYSQNEGIKIYILVQYGKDIFEKNVDDVDEVISCIDQNVIRIVDLRASLAELKKYDAKKYKSLFRGHMTKEGNNFVASRLWEAMHKQQ